MMAQINQVDKMAVASNSLKKKGICLIVNIISDFMKLYMLFMLAN